jgi:peroxiredoxin/uncharacterized membrane protein YphA (DoxX/SURF4 family)
MELIAVLIRVALAGVFAVAGIAKFARYRTWHASLEEFGVPPSVSTVVSAILPVVELIVAALILIPRFTAIGALAALTLVCIFITAILYNLIQGRRPACNCFGQLHSAPIGSATLVRNALLAFGAMFFTIPAFGIALNAALIIALTIVLILALLARALERQRHILDRLSELEDRDDSPGIESGTSPAPLTVGSPAPLFSLKSLDGAEVTLEDILTNLRTSILIFVQNNCGPCVALMPSISRWHRIQSDQTNLIVISKSSEDAFRKRLSKLRADWILLDGEKQVAKDYRATMSPAAVLVRPDGTIGSTVVFGETEITSLVENAVVPDSVIQDATG